MIKAMLLLGSFGVIACAIKLSGYKVPFAHHLEPALEVEEQQPMLEPTTPANPFAEDPVANSDLEGYWEDLP